MKSKVKNLWGLDKDPAIKAVLLMLQHEVGPGGFVLLDAGTLNDKAVRIISPRTAKTLSAYLYSYAQRKERYGLDLEFPYLIETVADDQTIRLNDLTAEEALENIIAHLEIGIAPNSV